MNQTRTLRFLVGVICVVIVAAQAFGQNRHWDDLRNLPFRENYPTADSTDRLYNEMLFHRATQVVQWSLPAMTLWAMKKGSEFRNGEMTLEFKGVSLVDGVPCALLQYDSGDSSYTMYMEALPGMDMIAQGASHYQGDVYVELGSNWLRKATLYELVVTEVKTNGEATENGIIERESLLKTLTKEEIERL